MKKLAVVIPIIVALICATAVAIVAIRTNAEKTQPEQTEKITEFLTEPLEFTTNLKRTKDSQLGDAYVKAEICISTTNEKEIEKLMKYEVQLKDLYIDFFNNTCIDDFSTGTKKDNLRTMLIPMIEELTNIKIHNVYFNSLIIQG